MWNQQTISCPYLWTRRKRGHSRKKRQQSHRGNKKPCCEATVLSTTLLWGSCHPLKAVKKWLKQQQPCGICTSIYPNLTRKQESYHQILCDYFMSQVLLRWLVVFFCCYCSSVNSWNQVDGKGGGRGGVNAWVHSQMREWYDDNFSHLWFHWAVAVIFKSSKTLCAVVLKHSIR